MKKYLTIVILLTSLNSRADYWTPKANYPGAGINLSVSFSIGTKGYVGCGFDSTSSSLTHNDFWEYNPSTNVWTQKANVGGVSRANAVSFSIGNLGYVGMGFTQFNGTLYDFWEYNPVSNIWTQKANFAGSYRQGATGFSIGNMGYVGMREDNNLTLYNDLWQYNPITDTWLQKTSCPCGARANANSFVIGTNAYIIAGSNSLIDVWEYNSITDSWVQKSNLPLTQSAAGAAFSICGLGYYGVSSAIPWSNGFWQYDPMSNTWSAKTNFMGAARGGQSYFTIGTMGYVGLGYPNDFYEYSPDSTCTTGIIEINKLSFDVFPNPFDCELNINTNANEQFEIILYDIFSRKILQQKFINPISFSTEHLAKGIYLYEVRSRNNLCNQGKLVKD